MRKTITGTIASLSTRRALIPKAKLLATTAMLPVRFVGFGTTLEKIRNQPDEIQRLVRATLRGIHYAKSNKQESVGLIMKWADLNPPLAEGGYDMAVSSWSNTGAPSEQSLEIAMDEIKTEQKLDASLDPSKAFDRSFVQR